MLDALTRESRGQWGHTFGQFFFVHSCLDILKMHEENRGPANVQEWFNFCKVDQTQNLFL